MAGKFVIRKEVAPEVLDWGELALAVAIRRRPAPAS